MHPLAAASRSRLLETEPKLFVFETSYYAFCGQYCFESVALNVNNIERYCIELLDSKQKTWIKAIGGIVRIELACCLLRYTCSSSIAIHYSIAVCVVC